MYAYSLFSFLAQLLALGNIVIEPANVLQSLEWNWIKISNKPLSTRISIREEAG